VKNIQLIQTADGSPSLLNIELNETYHSTHGAIQESAHVFIKNGAQFFVEKHNPNTISVFEVGFGTGLNALLSLQYSEESKVIVDYTTLEAFPVEWEVARLLNYSSHLKGESKNDYFSLLHQSKWSENVRISESFSLLKIKTTLQEFKFHPNQFDVIFFDAFAPSKQPEMWERSPLEKVVYSMKSGSVFVTYCAKGQLKRDLKSLGMVVESLPGPPGKREMVRATKK